MADEITVTISVTTTKSGAGYDFRYRPPSLTLDQATARYDSRVHSIGTSEENVTFADITAEGLIVLENLDSTNFVEYGKDDASTMKETGKLLAGDVHVFRLADAETLRMKADTASCDVLITCFDT